MNLQDSFQNEIEKLGEIEDNPTIAIAVSGGVDSIALTFLANNWIKKIHGKIIALTIDHDLREESGQEAEQIHSWLSKSNIEHHVIKWNYSSRPETNIQSKAREARYTLLTEWCKNHNILHLILAHHKDDQAETFMLRLERGSGLSGLACMSASTVKNNIRILRPLLDISKKTLIEYATSNNLQWVEDPSNEDDKYRRNVVRKKLNEDILLSHRLANTAKNLGRARSSLEKICANHMVQSVKIFPEAYVTLDLQYFIQIGEEEALSILSQILKIIGSDIINLRLNSLVRLYQKIKLKNFNSTLTLSGCKISLLKNDREKIIIYREVRKKEPIIKIEKNYVYFDNKFKIKFPENYDFSKFEVKYLTNQVWNKIIREDKNLENLLPKQIVPTLLAIFVNNDLFYIPTIGYINQNSSVKIDCYFYPQTTLTKNLFNYY